MIGTVKQWLCVCLMSGLLLSNAGVSAQVPSDTISGQELDALRNEGRYAEAITVLKRHITTLQAQGRLETPTGFALLNNLGELHYKLGLHGEAIPLYERALAIAKTSAMPDTSGTAITWRNLGIVYQLQGRSADALGAYSRSISILERTPNSQIQLASTFNNLAILFQEAKRYKDAETILLRVLQIYSDGLGKSHFYVATAYNNLGQLYRRTGDQKRAEEMLVAAVATIGQTFAPDHPQRARFLQNLGMLYAAKQDWPRATAHLREALLILQKQAQRGRQSREGELAGEAADVSFQKTAAGAFINSAMKIVTTDRGQTAVDLVREVFLAGQWRPSQAAASFVQMSVRRLKGDGALERLIRERQDLVNDWQRMDQRLMNAAISGSISGQTGTDRVRLAEIDKRISLLDAQIQRQFPEYASFINPPPLDVPQVQALLRDDEALVFFVETGSPSWVWVITKKDKNLALLNLSSETLAEQVALTRCGLDQTHWANPQTWPETTPGEVQRKKNQERVYARCRKLLPDGLGSNQLPFDLNRAHALHKAFFAGAEKAIAGKHLIIVPSPNLMSFPFATLVTEPALSSGYRDVKWLGTRQPISILPSIASLAAIRNAARPSKAPKPFLGFGNPLLDGSPAILSHRDRAKEARLKQDCAKLTQTAGLEKTPDVRASRLGIGEAFRGGTADVAILKAQLPLPETADELCEVARSLNAAPSDVFLGANATETAIKTMNDKRVLADYRILHFATHGLVAGNLPGLSEPALMLSPPSVASELDDGLLTASEVAQLQLDANWVVLSACNTAAGGAEGAEALSGLARAFFYAGARTLLVTHWEIDSQAAVQLTTKAFDAIKKTPRMSQAEAMRQSMAALVSGDVIPNAAHPSTWAAFALVGDGWRQ